ncbi:unnamed protein product [Larinioides sclopetarius]|uniref:Uncharacterized protein n=1 Tax=Larinioides sclopetarius TaxID=280406 RepID=A0AAV2AC60_9ARAC
MVTQAMDTPVILQETTTKVAMKGELTTKEPISKGIVVILPMVMADMVTEDMDMVDMVENEEFITKSSPNTLCSEPFSSTNESSVLVFK